MVRTKRVISCETTYGGRRGVVRLEQHRISAALLSAPLIGRCNTQISSLNNLLLIRLREICEVCVLTPSPLIPHLPCRLIMATRFDTQQNSKVVKVRFHSTCLVFAVRV